MTRPIFIASNFIAPPSSAGIQLGCAFTLKKILALFHDPGSEPAPKPYWS